MRLSFLSWSVSWSGSRGQVAIRNSTSLLCSPTLNWRPLDWEYSHSACQPDTGVREANMVRGVAKAMFASYFPKYFNREPGAIKVYSKLNLEIPKYSTFNVQTFLPDFRIFNRQIKSKPTLRLSLAPTSMPSRVLSPRHQLMT